MQAVDKLKLDTDTPAAGVRPKGLGMVSCVGTEYVPFKSPLPLDNKVSRSVCSYEYRVITELTSRTDKMHCEAHLPFYAPDQTESISK